MSGLVHPDRNRLTAALLMGAAIGAGIATGVWYVVRDRIDRVVDSWAKA